MSQSHQPFKTILTPSTSPSSYARLKPPLTPLLLRKVGGEFFAPLNGSVYSNFNDTGIPSNSNQVHSKINERVSNKRGINCTYDKVNSNAQTHTTPKGPHLQICTHPPSYEVSENRTQPRTFFLGILRKEETSRSPRWPDPPHSSLKVSKTQEPVRNLEHHGN